MPEANLLYAVTAVVVAGLVVWVAVVLRTAKEPWARPRGVALEPHAANSPVGSVASPRSDPALIAEPRSTNAGIDADETARATPVALSEGRARAAAALSQDQSERKENGKVGA